jgi:hypothetical protein
MLPWKLLSWEQAGQLLIEFFNRLGQLQAPDGDITLTRHLRSKAANPPKHKRPKKSKEKGNKAN